VAFIILIFIGSPSGGIPQLIKVKKEKAKEK